MKRITTVRAAVLGAILSTGLSAAHAQSIRSTNHYIGGAIGDTDLGTALRLFGGGTLTNIFGWEAQLTSFGSRSYQQGLFSYKHSAWSMGAYGVASFPVAPKWTVFGKAGAHYLRWKQSSAAGNVSDGSVELGIGAGVKWQFAPNMALRADFENIGGSGGDLATVGIQFAF